MAIVFYKALGWTLAALTVLFIVAELNGITVVRGTVWILSFFIPGFAQISW